MSGPKEPEGQEDAALIARIATEDRAAFAALFARYAVRIKAFLIKGGAAPDEAEEAAQEVMVSIWRRAGRYDPDKASVATWIYAIARNRRIDMIRRQRRPAPDPEDPLYRPDPPRDPARDVADRDRDAAIRAALDGLSEDQRAVVRAAFYLGQSQTEIAEGMGVALGTVKSRLRLAYGKLRAELGEAFSLELLDE